MLTGCMDNTMPYHDIAGMLKNIPEISISKIPAQQTLKRPIIYKEGNHEKLTATTMHTIVWFTKSALDAKSKFQSEFFLESQSS